MKSKSKKISPIGSDFDESLDQDLKDPLMAAYFINAAMEENDVDYLKIAVGRVARVHGISDVSKFTGLGREAIYKMLAENGNPGLRNVQQILSALGLELVVRAKNSPKHEPVDIKIKEIIKTETRNAVREALEGRGAEGPLKYKHEQAPRVSSRQATKKQSTKKVASFG